MVAYINGIYGDIAIPVTFNFLIATTVLTLFCLIQTNPPVVLLIYYSGFALICFTFLSTVFQQYSKVTELSTRAVRWTTRRVNPRNKYMKHRLKTCFSLKIRIGPFHTIEPATLVTAVTSIISYTTSLLIATNGASAETL